MVVEQPELQNDKIAACAQPNEINPMIEIHAWITLRYSDYDSEDHLQRDFIAKFKGYLAQHYNWVLENSYGRFINQNGLECFAIDVQHNHKVLFMC